MRPEKRPETTWHGPGRRTPSRRATRDKPETCADSGDPSRLPKTLPGLTQATRDKVIIDDQWLTRGASESAATHRRLLDKSRTT